jgi:phosphoenolpyruvate carboxykinase (GTP)
MAKRVTQPPKIFRINWFQRNERGRFLWPGFGENLRVLRWIVERSRGGGLADETPIGYIPKAASLIGDGLEISKTDIDQLLAVDRQAWKNNLKSQSDFFDTFGDHLPTGMREEHTALANRLKG